jgi:hypothetical protein
LASAIDIAVRALLADPQVSTLVGGRIYPIVAPQRESLPNIVVYQISEVDSLILNGHAAQFPESRISVVSRGSTATEMLNIGDAVKTALQNISRQVLEGRLASFFKGGSDVTQFIDDPPVFERTTDFRVRWQ